MSPIEKHLPPEDVCIEKDGGHLIGPYPARFAGNTVFFFNTQTDIQEGDVIVRKLPNGRDERNITTEVAFFPKMHKALPAHYQIKFTKEDVLKMQQKIQPASFNINNSQVQIGDHNTQNIINAIQELQNKIDASAATPKDKAEAKGLLSQFLNHPLTVAILGPQLASWLGKL